MKPIKALVGFAGFGGVEIALRAFGFEILGIEIDPAIAEVNRFNGGNVITADILMLNPADFVGYLLMHFSPPCPNFSLANQASSESELDISLARKICEFIRICRPEYFTLENVWAYRTSLSWLLIWYTLQEEGYGIDAWHLNAADYGVPQSRKRMIVVGRRDGRQPSKPWPTHSKTGDMFTKLWRGWYEAIEDLMPVLPESKFASWQWDQMQGEMKTYLMMMGTNRNGSDNPPGPAAGSVPRAFILGQGNYSSPKEPSSPADTVTANNNQTGVKAFVMDSGNSGANNGKGTIRTKDEPIFTLTTGQKTAPIKAVVINSRNTNRDLTIRKDNEPMMTVTAGDMRRLSSVPKAVIVDDSRILPIKKDGQPVFTITASERKTIRASLQDRVVSMTVRALARFQDFPDWFVLPGDPGLVGNPVLLADKRTDRELACRGIGNALPPGLGQAVFGSLEL